LHPHAVTLVAEMMKTLAQGRQIFIATQPPYMVDCFALENVVVASSQHGATQLHTLPRQRYQQWLDEDYLLSDLWLKEPVGDAS
jgi:predicted ATPase